MARLAASMVASSSNWCSAVSGKPSEKRIKVLRPGMGCRVFARLRMANKNDWTPKSASVWESCPMDVIKGPDIPVDAISATPVVEILGETAEYFTCAVARFSFSPSAVKFCTT